MAVQTVVTGFKKLQAFDVSLPAQRDNFFQDSGTLIQEFGKLRKSYSFAVTEPDSSKPLLK